LAKPDAQTAYLDDRVYSMAWLPMDKQPNEIWTLKISNPPPETYGFKFLVDEKDLLFDPKKLIPRIRPKSVELFIAESSKIRLGRENPISTNSSKRTCSALLSDNGNK
jgi:hypothetical protein